MTVFFGFFSWLGVFLATAGLVMFYRCSRQTSYCNRSNKRKKLRSREINKGFANWPIRKAFIRNWNSCIVQINLVLSHMHFVKVDIDFFSMFDFFCCQNVPFCILACFIYQNAMLFRGKFEPLSVFNNANLFNASHHFYCMSIKGLLLVNTEHPKFQFV